MVEHRLPKPGVEGSNPFSRSINFNERSELKSVSCKEPFLKGSNANIKSVSCKGRVWQCCQGILKPVLGKRH